ncbi:MAG: hypothetical protein ACRC6T_01625 [Sarcina sp.]
MSMPVITVNPNPITLAQAKADLIESIALEETGLSHIINAEGEKIQAALAMATTSGTTDATQILAVNASVQETLKVISKIEILLQYKLELAEKL